MKPARENEPEATEGVTRSSVVPAAFRVLVKSKEDKQLIKPAPSINQNLTRS